MSHVPPTTPGPAGRPSASRLRSERPDVSISGAGWPPAASTNGRSKARKALRAALADDRGSAAVEYVGLAVVVSMLMAAVASAVDSALGERLATAIVERMVASVSSIGT